MRTPVRWFVDRGFQSWSGQAPYAAMHESGSPPEDRSPAVADAWIPLETAVPRLLPGQPDPEWRPSRFVDGTAMRIPLALGRNRHREITEVTAAVIGARALAWRGGRAEVEPVFEPDQDRRIVIALPTGGFRDTDMEELRQQLAALRIGLLPVTPEDEAASPQPYWQSVLREMRALESSVAYGAGPSGPGELTLIDGPLHAAEARWPLVGLVKQEQEKPAYSAALREVVLALRPGERSPAFRVTRAGAELVCWYVRLHPGWEPLHGTVRVEAGREYLERCTTDLSAALDVLSAHLYALRATAAGYPRQHCSIEPIVYLERRLHARLPPFERARATLLRQLNLNLTETR